jgi:hypothetical protein
MPLPPIAAALELHSAVLLGLTPRTLAGVKLRYIQAPPVGWRLFAGVCIPSGAVAAASTLVCANQPTNQPTNQP